MICVHKNKISVLYKTYSFIFIFFFISLFLLLQMVSTNYTTTEEDKETAIKELERLFDLNADQLKKITQLLQNEMKIGLNKNDEDYTNIPMLPSWITRRPTGQELGEYLGLDLSSKYTLSTYF